MAKYYYVDLPNPQHFLSGSEDDNSWLNLTTTKTKEEAVALLQDRYGIRPEESALFISEGEDDSNG